MATSSYRYVIISLVFILSGPTFGKDVTFNATCLDECKDDLSKFDCSSSGCIRFPLEFIQRPDSVARIDMQLNVISFIPELPFKMLEYLDLSSNAITNATDNAFVKCVRLQTLKLSSNYLSILDDSMFTGLSNLQTLELDHNQIISVAEFPFLNLERLDLSYNEINELPENVFEKCAFLKTLNISSNALTHLDSSMFYGLHNVETLQLGQNKISDIGPSTFFSHLSLVHLNLSGNALKNLSYNSLSDLNMKILLLEQNHFQSIQKSYFAGSSDLQHLSLRGNEIQHIDSQAFAHMDELTFLDLGENVLQKISHDMFASGRRDPFNKIQTMYFDRNHIRAIDNVTFYPLVNLEYVFLDHNPIAYIGNFQTFPKSLKKFSLTENTKLDVIRNGTFTGLPLLTQVNLSHCYKLQEIQPAAFDGPKSNVTDFNVTGSRLSRLSSELLNWTRIKSLDLRDNPWNCDCHLLWMKLTLPHNITMKTVCTTPHQFKGKTVHKLNATSFSCSVFTRYRHSMGVVLIVVATLLFILGGAYIIHSYSRRSADAPAGSKARYTTLDNMAADETDASVSIQWEHDPTETTSLKNNPAPTAV